MPKDIDQLTGLELRKAVAEAVGWEWCGGRVPCAYQRAEDMYSEQVRFLGGISWDDAIAACEEAGVTHVNLVAEEDVVRVLFSGYVPVTQGPRNPESLCRALLKALEAKNEPTPPPGEQCGNSSNVGAPGSGAIQWGVEGGDL